MTKSLDATLQNVTHGFLRMLSAVMEQLSTLRTALQEGRTADVEARVTRLDADVDALEKDLEAACLRGLALQSPVARDLRLVVLIMKSLADIERAGDYAKHIARSVSSPWMAAHRSASADVQSSLLLLTKMLEQLSYAFLEHDLDAARQVILLDEQVDAHDEQMQRLSMITLLEQPDEVGTALKSSRLGREIERLGDHLKNVAERILANAASRPTERPD